MGQHLAKKEPQVDFMAPSPQPEANQDEAAAAEAEAAEPETVEPETGEPETGEPDSQDEVFGENADMLCRPSGV